MAYSGGMLIVSDTNGRHWRHQLPRRIRPEHAGLHAQLPVAATGFVSGLGGDGLGGSNADWYSFNVNAGDNLVLTTTTPGAPSASGLQFANDLDSDDQPLRRQRQPGRHRDRQRSRRPQRRHRLDGAHLGQLPRADPGRDQDQPGRVHDQRPGRHGRTRPVHGDLDQPGRRIGHRLPGLDHGRDLQQQRAPLEHQRQRFHDRRQRRHRLRRSTTPTP